jgi:hypothetical protein
MEDNRDNVGAEISDLCRAGVLSLAIEDVVVLAKIFLKAGRRYLSLKSYFEVFAINVCAPP